MYSGCLGLKPFVLASTAAVNSVVGKPFDCCLDALSGCHIYEFDGDSIPKSRGAVSNRGRTV